MTFFLIPASRELLRATKVFKSSYFGQLSLFWGSFLEENCTKNAKLLSLKGSGSSNISLLQSD